MKEEEELNLIDKYNHLFAKRFIGFETPSGWDWIVEKYLEKTQWDVEKNKLNIQIIQIKEKFGQLRIYTEETIISNEYHLPLDEENQAYCVALADYTCEKCGCLTRKKQYTNGWITGLCSECFKERQNETE